MTDNARKLLSDARAPADEQFAAMAELQKNLMPTQSELIPANNLVPIIDWMRENYAEQEMTKALMRNNVIHFPSMAARDKKPGMQSVDLDDNQVGVWGDYYERPGAFGFDAMRMMVEQTPVLSAVIWTRIRQMQRFARAQENGKGPGFEIRMRDRDAFVGKPEKESITALQTFFTNCGWETNPRARARLKRDDFTSFLTKQVRDSLTMDSAPIETEFKRNRSQGMDGIYAVDGATIRLCTEVGYQGDDEIRALQVVQGQIRSAYTFDDLIYVPRNPRADVIVGGYGQSETELLVKTVTNLLNAMTYNGKFFDSNAIPKGLLHLTGDYDANDLAAFKRMWSAMTKGIANAWTMPVLVSKDQESKAAFENFGQEVNEMMFSKWMVFLTSIICAVYGISPEEINFESFSSKTSSLGGNNDTEDKIISSKDKGLLPLLHYFENVYSDFIVAEFSDKYCFRFTGLDDEDEKQGFEEEKLVLTVNEMRAKRGYEKIEAAWGDAPLNPSLIGPWQAEQQQGQQDFGQPQGEMAEPADENADDDGQPLGAASGSAAPAPAGNDFGGDKDSGDFGAPAHGTDKPLPAASGDEYEPNPMTKSFGLPIFTIEA